MPASPDPRSSFAQPLLKFGRGLTCSQSGDGVRWTYAGNTAVVAARPDGALSAKFIAAPHTAGATVRAVYSSGPSGYAIDASGVARMVADLADFFSGAREPRFTFIDLQDRDASLA